MSSISTKPFLIGEWLVDPELGCIQKDGESVKLEPKVMDLLLYLAQHPGKVLTREELEQAVWVGTVVGYDALTSAVIKIRKAFGDNSRNPWLIETLSKKGYRFIAPVLEVQPGVNPATPAAPANLTNKFQSKRRWFTGLSILALALIVSAITWYASRRSAPVIVSAANPSIVVLPFANLSGDPHFEYFSDGITEDITTDLSKLSGLLVIAPNSANSYKNQPLSLKSVARALNVRFVVEGSVRRAGNEIRVTAKLIDAHSGSHLWAERYDRKLQDIFSVQDDVTHNIVSALALTLTDKEKAMVAHRYTDSVEAYDLLLRGQSLYARSTKEDNSRARDLYRKAIGIDPKFARAYAALALTYAEDFRFGWSSNAESSLQQAEEFARKGVALDNTIPQTNWVLGYVLVSKKQFDDATAAAERAIAVDPNNADAYTTLAYGRVYQGRSEEAINLVRKAMRLNPHYPSQYKSILGRAYYYIGNYKEAIEILRDAIDKNPVRAPPRLYLILSYVALGQMQDAAWEVDQLQVNNPGFSLATLDQVIPVKDQEQLARIRRDLKSAGLK